MADSPQIAKMGRNRKQARARARCARRPGGGARTSAEARGPAVDESDASEIFERIWTPKQHLKHRKPSALKSAALAPSGSETIWTGLPVLHQLWPFSAEFAPESATLGEAVCLFPRVCPNLANACLGYEEFDRNRPIPGKCGRIWAKFGPSSADTVKTWPELSRSPRTRPQP